MAAKKRVRRRAREEGRREEVLGEEGRGEEGWRQEGGEAARRRPPRRAAKRTPNAAFMKAMTPSAQLGAVVGSAPLPRTEVTKKLWAYIKRKGLQDAKNRRRSTPTTT